MASGTIQTGQLETVTVTPVGQSTININATRSGKFVLVNGINAVYPSNITTDTQIATLSKAPTAQAFGVGKTVTGADVFVFADTLGRLYVSGLTPVNANTNMYFSFVYLVS